MPSPKPFTVFHQRAPVFAVHAYSREAARRLSRPASVTLMLSRLPTPRPFAGVSDDDPRHPKWIERDVVRVRFTEVHPSRP